MATTTTTPSPSGRTRLAAVKSVFNNENGLPYAPVTTTTAAPTTTAPTTTAEPTTTTPSPE